MGKYYEMEKGHPPASNDMINVFHHPDGYRVLMVASTGYLPDVVRVMDDPGVESRMEEIKGEIRELEEEFAKIFREAKKRPITKEDIQELEG